MDEFCKDESKYNIKFDYKSSKPISGNDLLPLYAHSIRLPFEYRFLNYEVEKDYSQYISIKHCDHNVDISPELFDFENINEGNNKRWI